MKSRPLGRTGLVVSEVGLGAWGLGAAGWPGVSDEVGVAGVVTAIELGVTFIDTALAYGQGHSERLIAKALRGRSDRATVAVATKIPPKNWVWPASPESRIADVFPADHVRAATETSLGHLEREAIDVQQFHVWHDAWLTQPEWDATRRTMEALKREGKVRHWGVSLNDNETRSALRALDDPLFETAQVIYNIFERAPERDLFPAARERGVGIIARVPFDEGTLAGAIRPDTTFPETDWRKNYFRGERLAEAARRAEALLPLLGDEAATLAELALRFVLSRPEVSTVIPGMRRPEHARANTAVSDARALSPELLRRLEAHAWVKNWYAS